MQLHSTIKRPITSLREATTQRLSSNTKLPNLRDLKNSWLGDLATVPGNGNVTLKAPQFPQIQQIIQTIQATGWHVIKKLEKNHGGDHKQARNNESKILSEALSFLNQGGSVYKKDTESPTASAFTLDGPLPARLSRPGLRPQKRVYFQKKDAGRPTHQVSILDVAKCELSRIIKSTRAIVAHIKSAH